MHCRRWPTTHWQPRLFWFPFICTYDFVFMLLWGAIVSIMNLINDIYEYDYQHGKLKIINILKV